MKHLPPVKSDEHRYLLESAIAAGFSANLVRDFLWLLNAHPQLISLFLVASNLQPILSLLQRQLQVDLEEYGIAEWPRLAQWILRIKRGEAGRFPPAFDAWFGLHDKHPVQSKGFSRHGMYSLLCNIHQETGWRNIHRMLSGYLLLAHIQAVRHFVSRHSYEHYDESPEILTPHRPVYLATKALREFSMTGYISVLKQIVPLLPPKQVLSLDMFADILDSLKFKGNRPTKVYFNGFRHFLATRNETKRKYEGGNKSSGKKTGGINPGFVGDGNEVQPWELPKDEDDPFENSAEMEVFHDGPSHISATETEQEELDQDVAASELGEGSEIILLDYGCTKKKINPAGAMLAAIGQARHKKMANQFLPWQYDLLTRTEIGLLLRAVDKRFSQLIVQKHWFPNDEILAEALVLCLISFWTGQSLGDLKEIQICDSSTTVVPAAGLQHQDCILGKGRSVPWVWRFPACEPVYNTERIAPVEIVRQRTEHVVIPDVAGIHMKMEALDRRRFPDRKGLSDCCEMKESLFPHPVIAYKKAINGFLAFLSPDKRITSQKISDYLFRFIAATTDISHASAIFGRPHQLNNARMHYFTPAVEKLIQTYTQATDSILDIQAGLDQITSEHNPWLSGQHVGSRLCLTMKTLQNAVSGLLSELNGYGDQDAEQADVTAIIARHNTLTLYTVLMFGYSTSCRAVISPLCRPAEVDLATGLIVLSDKNNPFQSKSRPAWVSPDLFLQLQMYEQHCRKVLLHLETYHEQKQKKKNARQIDLTIASSDPCFFLHEEFFPTLVSPADVALTMERYLPVPANAHRLFMRTNLIERGCPVEVVDAWMGHWNMGQEPWSRFSSFSIDEYFNSLQDYLLPLLQEIGWQAVPEIKMPGGPDD